ncbi:toxin-antitoxin system HicB family antitoxin [Actinokineospora iranica]|uniref:HicB family protein n=1 Tax=Actinokineospora iranica TaxID=1271860 RepID=A0A1G6KJ09_9PSEU|nr:toxin-antitoxin system HicB family antitoxin [Actinokineospora iranica]SDC31020.1 HicB family protein [Actinokineospora iranica]
MDLSPYIASLRDDLATTASAGDDTTRRAAAVLAAAIEPSARLAIMNALADLAAEVTAHLPDHVVEVRLDGRDVRVAVTDTRREPTEEHAPPPPPPPNGEGGGGDMSRMTLRLFEELKAKAERAAAAQGVSLNAFVQQAVQGALSGQGKSWGGVWSAATGSASSSSSSSSTSSSDSGSGGSRVRGWYEG